MKKYSRLSSTAVVTGSLRIKDATIYERVDTLQNDKKKKKNAIQLF